MNRSTVVSSSRRPRGPRAAGRAVRTRTGCSRTWPPSRPPPRRRTRPCIRRSISAACCAAGRSTAPRRSPLGTPGGTPSWWSGRRRSPAAFGSNPLCAPLDKRSLEGTESTGMVRAGLRARGAPVLFPGWCWRDTCRAGAQPSALCRMLLFGLCFQRGGDSLCDL